MAVPAVGMAIPNYSGPPQFGYPNSEVAWYAFSPFKAEWLECILLSNQFASRAFEVFLYQSWVCSAVFIYAFQCCIHSSDSCLHWCLTWHFGARKSRLLLKGGLFISFMSRVPVLAGGGAIGTGYAAPYMTMEGTPSHMYYTQPATQPASFCPTGLVILLVLNVELYVDSLPHEYQSGNWERRY